VKLGDGCATVTGYKLPPVRLVLAAKPLVPQRTGKAGVRFHARSQDIGLAALVVVPQSNHRVGSDFLNCGKTVSNRYSSGVTDFSDKEKDEASLPRVCVSGLANTFILRFGGG